MKLFYKVGLLCFALFVMSLARPVLATDRPSKVLSTAYQYNSPQQEGLIGVTDEIPFDSPADNIFHVNIERPLCEEDKIWLVYDLDGVQDHTSVSRSINDQLSVGGYLVKKRRGWSEQREQVSAAWLKTGDNIVRFTTPGNVQHSYRIKNLRIEIEPNSKVEQEIIFNQPSKQYFFDKAYLKGLLNHGKNRIESVRIAGKPVRLFNGEFETIIDFTSNENTCVAEVEIGYADGTTSCYAVSFEEPVTPDFSYGLNSITHRSEAFASVEKPFTLTLQGASLITPEKALKSATHLSLTTLREVDMPPLDGGMVNVTKNHDGFRFLPHGTNFNLPASVIIPFDVDKIPDGYTEKDIRTYYFDEQSHHWIPLEVDTVLMEKGEVISKTLHFTDMINGILKVPESPEVDAYNSTSIKGIKAANPTAAVNLINPPQANNTGGASLGYPINIPAGRGGMQPQLSIGYNSGGGNGWMGLGWNLAIPMISIETRWGVPRYDSLLETETYTMSGEMLTPVAHRGELQDRSSGDKRFYPRVEGSFNKIIRHGNKPWNYWWEVIDKSGTKYFYGGQNSALDQSSVLRTNESGTGNKGNVAQWCLREVRDLNGNTVLYHYDKVMHSGVEGGAPGYQIYIKRITYTGHNGSEGAYEVVFNRERELTPSVNRKDKVVIANLGFKQVTADLLKEIRIKFKSDNIRSYVLNYKTGAFEKTLLDKIVERDAQDQNFTEHAFEYYDEVGYSQGYKPFNIGEEYNTYDDQIIGGFLNKNAFNDKASFLSGSESENIGGGLSVTVGTVSNLATKTLTAGINYSYSRSKSDGRILMLDINGDGLPDKVMMFKEGRRKELKYRPQVKNQDGVISYGDLRPVNGMNQFLEEVSNSHDFGIESNFGIFAGLSYNMSKSKTTTYFSEVNGDGLIDIVKDGKVYFNSLDANGDPTFSNSSAATPNPIFTAGTLDGNLVTVNQQEVDLLKEQNPLHDMVRSWRAPFSGQVSIYAPVSLLEDTTEARRAYTTADGVRVAVQHKGLELWSEEISATDYNSKLIDTLKDIAVQKGDQIYFRVHSIEDGMYDQVKWNPVVIYEQHSDTLLDANKKPLYAFTAKEDFLIASNQTLGMPFTGKVSIQSNFKKPITSDSVLVEIVSEFNSVSTVVYSKHLSDQDTIAAITDFEKDVVQDEKLYFRALAHSNIAWEKLRWKSLVQYRASYDTLVKDIVDEEGNYLVNLRPVPEYSLYPTIVKKSIAWISPVTDSVTVSSIVNFKFDAEDGDMVFTIKKYDSLIAKQFLTIKDTTAIDKFTKEAAKPIKIGVKKGDKIFFEFHTRHPKLITSIDESKARIVYDSVETVEAGLHTLRADADMIYGTLYRQWGMFSYNGNDGRGSLPIDESKLKLSVGASTPPSIDLGNASSEDEMNDTFTSSGGYQANKDQFILMGVDSKKQRWIGNDDFTYIGGDTLSSSRMGLDQISAFFPEMSQGAGVAFAIDKITKSNQTTLAANAGPLGGNAGTGNSRVITDFMDMNGDRHPDILGEYKIQYTLPTGGLESAARSNGWEFGHRTSLLSGGLSAGGSFAKSGKEAGNSAKNSTFSSIGQATSLSLSGLWSSDDAQYTWMDINGDGLPDRVNAENGKVSLNLGYSFAPEEPWGQFEIRKGSSSNVSGGLGINIKNLSIAGGVGISRSDNTLKETLMDVNGDGLPDKVISAVGPMVVYFNTGAGFSSEPEIWGEFTEFSKGASTSRSANAAFTIGIPLVPPTVVAKLSINPKVFYSKGFNRQQIQVSDIDGDGNPDYLFSNTDGDLTVATSTIGRTNMLKAVARPLKAKFEMTYSRVGNTYELPNSQWVLDSVKVFDGFVGDGVDEMLTTYRYENGYYDRHERDFYGFEKVISRTHDTEKDNSPVYTTVTQTFNNDNYYEKGLLLTEVMTDAAGKKYVEKENKYALKDIKSGDQLSDQAKTSDAGNAFPALTETYQRFFEGQDDSGKSTHMKYEYDTIGNVTAYTDFGDEGEEDNISAAIEYHHLQDIHVTASPKKITVLNGSTVLRERESIIDPATGDILQIKQKLSDSEIALHDMVYDAYGNLSKITRPENASGQRLSFDYVYDTEVHTYTTKVTNSYGYSSEAEYDYRFGQVLKSTDLNGNEIKYELDDLGRVKQITGPYEKNSGYTIKFSYLPNAEIPHALTEHYDPANPTNTLKTAIFVDGLGRVLQTKKDVAIFDGDGKADKEMMVVSGQVLFDAFGRTVSARYPVTAPATSPAEFITEIDDVDPTTTTYDVLNRTLEVVLPDKAVTKTQYGFGSDRDGKNQFSTKTTDANGKQTEQFTDVKGRVTAVKNYTAEKDIWTSFKYNAISEQVEATNDLGHTTYSEYDNFGRRTKRVHPDAGTTNYTYDLAGNLRGLVTANLAKEGQAILYTYDFERLTEITYPQNIENNVKYTYGEAGATDNRAGRIVLQEDASGAQEFFYGPLGEVVKNVRTIVIPQHDEQTYTTEWKYDTWNRLTSMTYADGEVVTYNYNAGGLLRSMTGKKKNANYAYVNQLGYDKFEQRVFLAYGNGTKTNYQYEPDRRRLANMSAQTSAKRVFMDNVYTYDKVNNILSLKNNAPIPSANLMGGSSEYNYSYDDLYRLTSAEGFHQGANEEHSYTLNMNYNSVGGIIKKNQVHKKKDQEQKKTTYNLDYAYGETQPNAPTKIGDQSYTYDANGNQTGWTSDVSGQRRTILWDEENRIRSIYDNGSQHHYIYDASGERVIKGKSTGQRIFVNGEWKAGSGQMGNYTVYVNPYLVLKSGSYTKHYYIEGQRIVSKLGGGWDNNGKGPLKAGGDEVDYVGKSQKVFDGIVKNLKFLGADGQILTAGKSGKVPPGQLNGSGGGQPVTEAFRYFYHPDHLGSTSYVTDASGEVYQHLEYMAFGETFVEEHSNTDRTPYLFNGKELDEETGLYYYGARYYDARTSVWLSVDPLAEQYPSWSPFIYSFDNPINFIDPDGKQSKPKTRAVISPFSGQQVLTEISKQGGLTSQPGKMQPSLESIQVTISYESLSLSMYDVDGDPKGNTTIGFGHKIHDGAIDGQSSETDYKEGITFETAVQLLVSDIAAINTTLSNRVSNRKGIAGNMTQAEYDVAFDLEYNTGNSGSYLNRLEKIKKLESDGKQDKAAEKRADLSKWLEKQYPGRDKKRGVSRALMFDGSYAPKESILEEVVITGKKITKDE